MKENKVKVSFRFNKAMNEKLAMVAQKLSVTKTLIVENGIQQILRKLENERL